MTEHACWKCRSTFDLHPTESIGFRRTCDSCDSYLHVCRACKFYKPGQPNDCLVPGTERVADREYYNYCDEFQPGNSDITQPKRSLDDARRLLFGDDD